MDFSILTCFYIHCKLCMKIIETFLKFVFFSEVEYNVYKPAIFCMTFTLSGTVLSTVGVYGGISGSFRNITTPSEVISSDEIPQWKIFCITISGKYNLYSHQYVTV